MQVTDDRDFQPPDSEPFRQTYHLEVSVMIISVQGVCNPLRFGHRFTRYLAFAQQGVPTQRVVVQASGVHRQRTSDTTYGNSGVKGFSSSTINMKRSDSMENLLKSVTVSR